MSEYTPEPWRVGKCRPYMGVVVSDTPVPEIGGSAEVDYYGGHLIGESITPANARRIVACVNACVGMADPAAEIAKLRAEREELIKAGNVMRRFIMSWRDCLDGVQMSEASFIRDCGIDRWNRALAEKGE